MVEPLSSPSIHPATASAEVMATTAGADSAARAPDGLDAPCESLAGPMDSDSNKSIRSLWSRLRDPRDTVRADLLRVLARVLSPSRRFRAGRDRRRLTRLGFDDSLINSLEAAWSSREADRTARRSVSMWLAPSHPGSLLFLGTAYTVIGTAVIEYPPTHVAKGTTVSQEEWGIYLVGLAVVFLIGFLFSAVAITTRQWILTRFGDPDRALGRAAAALLREIIRPQTPCLLYTSPSPRD